ncbi:MAG: hypothetical protein WC716_15510 [Chitinophagaceae bacterium]|jgi:ABC-type glycerol-3-phosphate transport system substrate-binding protein
MKLVKISIVALSMGLFLASCGGNAETTAPAADTTVVVAPVEPTPAPVAVDSVAAPVDSVAAAPAPAAH